MILEDAKRLRALLSREERRELNVICCAIAVMGIVDAIGVGSILPFLAVLSDPELSDSNPFLASVKSYFGIQENKDFLVLLGGASLSIMVVGQAYKLIMAYWQHRFIRMREYTISNRLFHAYLNEEYAQHIRRNSSEMGASILSETEKVVTNGIGPLVKLLSSSASAAAIVVLVILVNPTVALVLGIVVGTSYTLIYGASRRMIQRFGQERLDANTDRFRVVQEAFGAFKTSKVRGLEAEFVKRYRIPARIVADRLTVIAVLFEAPRFLLEAIVYSTLMVVLLSMIVGAGSGLSAIVPVFGVYAFAGARLFPAVQQIFASVASLRFQRPVVSKLEKDLQEIGEISPKLQNRMGERLELNETLELRDVSYSYPGATKGSLTEIKLRIRANTSVAFVGTTGAGKTTAVDLILGLLSPSNGQLLVDGLALTADNVSRWQASVGYVPQEIFLIDDTVAANIAFGLKKSDIDYERVIDAARAAKLDAFVTSELEKQYETQVGDKGVRLSGGQRQRIGIARALYHNPSVLVLDEATSALDNLTEKAVMDAIESLGGRKTVILIAHRLSTVRNCDEIFLLDSGRIMASGTYMDLLQSNEAFRATALAGQ